MVANQLLTVGFRVAGADSVLTRAVGPGLAGFGVTNALEDPRIALFSGTTQLDSNDDWSATTTPASLFSAAGAFPLTAGSRDAALARVGASTKQALGGVDQDIEWAVVGDEVLILQSRPYVDGSAR